MECLVSSSNLPLRASEPISWIIRHNNEPLFRQSTRGLLPFFDTSSQSVGTPPTAPQTTSDTLTWSSRCASPSAQAESGTPMVARSDKTFHTHDAISQGNQAPKTAQHTDLGLRMTRDPPAISSQHYYNRVQLHHLPRSRLYSIMTEAPPSTPQTE